MDTYTYDKLEQYGVRDITLTTGNSYFSIRNHCMRAHAIKNSVKTSFLTCFTINAGSAAGIDIGFSVVCYLC